MWKITDIDYTLPIINALSPHQSFDTGANRPMLIRGVGGNGVKGDFVVKFLGAERMSSEASLRELLAAFIAAQMEIKVVQPVIVNISKEFVDLLKGDNAWQYAHKSVGYNFGSEYLTKFTTIIPGQDLHNKQLNDAQTIFAFDVVIQNPDRRLDKPNMLTDGTNIVIYDHELAFSFVMEIFPNPKPWELREADLEWINRHCVLPRIRGKEYDFEEFSRRFDNLDENFWITARNLVPKEWLSEQFDRIKQHFSAICSNKDSFIIELKKLMS
jgi:hypothetical protein